MDLLYLTSAWCKIKGLKRNRNQFGRTLPGQSGSVLPFRNFDLFHKHPGTDTGKSGSGEPLLHPTRSCDGSSYPRMLSLPAYAPVCPDYFGAVQLFSPAASVLPVPYLSHFVHLRIIGLKSSRFLMEVSVIPSSAKMPAIVRSRFVMILSV